MNAFAEGAARVAAGADPRREARRLIDAMTTEEKLACLDGDTPFWDGLIDSIQGGYWQHPWPAAAVARLGIPGIQFSDGPRGVVVGRCTAFPVSMARGASFDPHLEERIGDAIGRELRAMGANFYGGVCVNLLRHPAWGRAQETYGEDPLHVGEMGAALCRGVQRHALACVKHFACNSMENARFKVDVHADERALHEVYLPHFRRVVQEGVASVMSAYNSVNGNWCGENRELLTDILRQEWAFEGFVISDFQFGLRDPVASVEAGLDIEMPYIQLRAQQLPGALARGEITVAQIESSIERILTTLLRFWSRLERGQPSEIIACPEHRALAREAAQKSIVLLRNQDSILPLEAARLRRVAVVGELAAVANLGDGGSSNVRPPAVVTVLDGLRAALPQIEVEHDDGRDLARAAALSSEADVVVLVVGYTSRDEGEFIDVAGVADLFHLFPPMTDPATAERLKAALNQAKAGAGFLPGGDRVRLGLSEGDEVLIETIAAANARTIVVMMGGSSIVCERWRHLVPAVVMLWYPGMEGGHALADVLLGNVDASGRLPFAIPTDAEHLPPFDRDATSAIYDLLHGQWKLDHDERPVAYPFGFGLSYTSFELANLELKRRGDDWIAELEVCNRGTRSGSTVVQVYGGVVASTYLRPPRRLLGFRRCTLDAGARARIEIPFSLSPLSIRHQGKWIEEAGTYRIVVAQHSRESALRAEITIA